MPEKALKNTLKVQRAKKDLTQEQLAQMVGVTRKTINTVEKGKYVPS
ncbi:MAG: helix-turn-helix domain-containing protein, partial [Candidatus Aminicenantes bacterium]|nr:helix-turn-helix domain-containing protein [Candidatus Aminicenantes bacterium]